MAADDQSQQQPVLVIMGGSGSGKSAVAGILAGQLGRDLEEGDDQHPPATSRRWMPYSLADEDQLAAITTRDVPPHVHDALTAAARRRGQSLKQYVLDVLEREARFARNREWVASDPIGVGVPLPTIVGEIRNDRDGIAAS